MSFLMCSITRFLNSCNSSWDIPQIQFLLRSFSYCLSSSDVFWCLFLEYSFFYFFLLQIILSIDHNPFFVTFVFFTIPFTLPYALSSFFFFFSFFMASLLFSHNPQHIIWHYYKKQLFYNHNCPFFHFNQHFAFYSRPHI